MNAALWCGPHAEPILYCVEIEITRGGEALDAAIVGVHDGAGDVASRGLVVERNGKPVVLTWFLDLDVRIYDSLTSVRAIAVANVLRVLAEGRCYTNIIFYSLLPPQK